MVTGTSSLVFFAYFNVLDAAHRRRDHHRYITHAASQPPFRASWTRTRRPRRPQVAWQKPGGGKRRKTSCSMGRWAGVPVDVFVCVRSGRENARKLRAGWREGGREGAWKGQSGTMAVWHDYETVVSARGPASRVRPPDVCMHVDGVMCVCFEVLRVGLSGACVFWMKSAESTITIRTQVKSRWEAPAGHYVDQSSED